MYHKQLREQKAKHKNPKKMCQRVHPTLKLDFSKNQGEDYNKKKMNQGHKACTNKLVLITQA